MAAFGTEIRYSDEAWTPWFDRQAENCQFRAELIDYYMSGTGGDEPELNIGVYTKNREDTGDGSIASNPSAGSAIIVLGGSGLAVGDIKNAIAVDLKELVRFKLTWNTGLSPDWIRYRFLTPAWFDASSSI